MSDRACLFKGVESLWLKIIADAIMQAKKANYGFRSDPRLLPRIRDVSFKIFQLLALCHLLRVKNI